ncbi:MAG: 1-deoxy-D-xylulose-5-phosphate reductoisomerase [Actinomycetales bacterium]|nr:MAG: 1-deoxy-D-xylulose-5-phosphate reductoisomerase [Actinomycetales bacterium]
MDLVILGSTGSIGTQALEIVEANPDKFRVIGLSAGSKNLELLAEQANKFSVPVVATTGNREVLISKLGKTQVIDGPTAASEIAAMTCGVVLNGISGSIGLGPTLAALSVGNKVALANKESLVAGGDLVMAFGRDRIIPVDSEHSALYQCFLSGKASEVKQVILTASGGPFRDRSDLSDITVAEALNHPTWSMGPVVTINSATLMNKGLEIIEAHYLFDLPYSKISAVIHPQSIVHSMVEFVDGSTIAQASPPNMKGPIAYAISGANRIPKATPPINWNLSHSWDFAPIDNTKFPAVDLARRCGELGGGLPAIFNAANEVAVEGFLNGAISFAQIVDVVDATVQKLGGNSPVTIRSLADVSAIENDSRVISAQLVQERK